MKITIQKPVGILGEVWLVEIPVSNDVLKSKDPVAGIEAQSAIVTRVMDNRLGDLNQRLIDHNKAAMELDPKGLLAVRQCVELMYGQLSGPAQVEVQRPQPELAPRDASVTSHLERALEAADAIQGGDSR